jgi:hypothetical protein
VDQATQIAAVIVGAGGGCALGSSGAVGWVKVRGADAAPDSAQVRQRAPVGQHAYQQCERGSGCLDVATGQGELP